MAPAKKSKGGTEEKEDIIQAVLFADNFDKHLFGTNCDYLPEGLIPLCNRRMIDYSLEALAFSGVNEVFVYSSRNTGDLKAYLKESKWQESLMTVSVIASEDSMSLGDALRDLDAKAVLENDFILMKAGVITNLNLKPLLEQHRQTALKDKGTVMTLIHRKMSSNHRSRSQQGLPVVIADGKTGKIISYRNDFSGRKIAIPVESLQPEMELFMDTCDTGIAICSATVPPTFTDNFDFVSIQDFMKEILVNEEIMGYSMYFRRLESGYAGCITDFEAYKGISLDILQRWSYPLVPDMPFGPNIELASYPFNYNFTYRGSSIKIGGRSVVGPLVVVGHDTEIGKSSKVVHSSVGDNCKIGDNVTVQNSFLGNNVVIGDGCFLQEVIVEDDTVVSKDSDIKPWTLVGATKRRIDLPVTVDIADDSSVSVISDEDIEEPLGDFEMFLAEVLESLHRGSQEKVATENLVLEINSSKFAYNMSSEQVTVALMKAVLELVPKLHPEVLEEGPVKVNWQKHETVIMKFKELFSHYVKSEDAQADLLGSLEEYGNDHVYFRPLLMHSLHLLYNEDILSEDPIMEWYNKNSLYDAGEELRNLVKKFIEWLEEAESEDSD